MGFKSSSLLCLAIFLAVSSAVHAMNITETLGEYPEFGAFNKYLTESKLADQINRRNTITILAISNGSLGDLSGKPAHAIKAVLSAHIVLDYFDERKLVEAINSNETLTTLYQASGLAQYSQGFLKVGLVGDGEIAFGSAADGAPLNSELVRTVTSIPFNVSILEVARAIRIPGIDSITLAQPPVQAYKPAPAQAPPPDEEVSAPSPADEIEADAPVNAPAPTPVSSPSLAPAPVAADQAAADAPPPSSSSRTTIGLVGAVMSFASLLVAM